MGEKVYVGLSFPKRMIAHFEDCVELLEKNGFEVVVDENDHTLNEEELVSRLENAYAFVAAGEKVNDSVLDRVPTLKIVSRMGVGYEKIDVDAMNRHGAALTITPGANAKPVAEYAISLMMAAARKVCCADNLCRSGGWRTIFGTSLEGKTLGIIGLGHIGKQVVKYLSGYDMRVITFTRSSPDPEFAKKYHVEALSLEDVLSQSDFVFIHAPSTPQTYHLLNKERFALMKENTILVNCARGEIVDEEALIEALKNHQIGAAALDVFEKEPVDPDNPLLKMDNVVLSPHTAGMTFEGRKIVVDMAFQNIIDIRNGIAPKGLVNKDVAQVLNLK